MEVVMDIIIPGFRVRVCALDSASSRTKNRLLENGEEGFMLRQRANAIGLGNRPSVLLEALIGKGKRGDRWLGWLPNNEIEIEIWVDEP